MADLSDKNASLPIRLIGADPITGIESFFAKVDSNGSLQIAGEGTAGSPAGGVLSIQGVVSGTPIPTSQSGNWSMRLQDGSGNAITSQASGAQRALDVGINVSGVQVDPRSIRLLTGADVVTANQGGTWTTGRTWTLATGTDSVTIAPLTNSSVVKAQLQDNAGTAVTLGQKAMAASLPVVLASDQSNINVVVATSLPAGANVIGAVTQSGGPWTQNVTQFGGTNVSTGTGASGAGIPRVTVSNDSAVIVSGNVASGATDSGNPVKVGGVFNTSLPTLTNGQRGDIQLDSSGRQIIAPLTNTSVVKAQLQDNAGTAITLGQKVMASSVPVVLASDQASIPVTVAGVATAANQTTEITSLQLLDDVPSAFNAAFVKGSPSMGQLDDTSTTVATEDNVAPVRITPQRAQHVNFRNQAGTEIGTTANPVQVAELLDGGGASGVITGIGTTPVAVRVGGSNLANRGNLLFTNVGSVTLYWGMSNSITGSANATPLFRNQPVSGNWGPNTTIWVVAPTGSGSISVNESARV